MLTLEAAQTLAAGASVASQVTCTVFGMELSGGGSTETYKVLDQRQLAASPATIYTVPGSTVTFVKTITLVNNDSTARTVQFFVSGTTASDAITPVLTIPALGMAIYEDNTAWQFYDNTGRQVTTQYFGNAIQTGYFDWTGTSNPAAPGSDTLRLFAKNISGRMLPKWIGPSGVDTPFQSALFGNNTILYTPTSGTTATGGFGTLWAKGTSSGTVDHPTPATTSPAKVNQMKRTRHRNVVTTTNQSMGITSIAAGMPQYWRGNAAGLGGFFFFSRFIVEAWPANTCRLFVGLQSSATENGASDTLTNDCVGFSHITTDGANVIVFATRDGTTTNRSGSISSVTLAAGQAFDAYIYCKPNDSTIYYRLDDVNAGTTLVDTSTASNLPTSTVFMGPSVLMSNGTANTTANTVGIGVNRIYVESDY